MEAYSFSTKPKASIISNPGIEKEKQIKWKEWKNIKKVIAEQVELTSR